MANILPNSQPKNETNSYISRFFKEHKLGTLLNKANIRKEDGISPLFLFQFIFSLVLHGKNLYRALESGRIQGIPEKDTVYRFYIQLAKVPYFVEQKCHCNQTDPFSFQQPGTCPHHR